MCASIETWTMSSNAIMHSAHNYLGPKVGELEEEVMRASSIPTTPQMESMDKSAKVKIAEQRFTAELQRDERHIVLVTPEVKAMVDEAQVWYDKHFRYLR